MLFIFELAAFALFSLSAYGSEVGYSQTRSDSFESHRFKFSYTPSRAHKFSVTGRKTNLKTDVDDPNTSSFKFQYRYRTQGDSTYALELRTGNESYFYELAGVGLRTAFAITESTKLNLNLASLRRRYSLDASEFVQERAFGVGLEQEFFKRLTVSVFHENESYKIEGRQGNNYLKGQFLTNDDISSYLSLLFQSSTSVSIEYSFEVFALGLSRSVDRFAFVDNKTTTTDVYTDIFLSPSWTMSLMFSRGRIEGSSQNADAYSLGLGYSF